MLTIRPGMDVFNRDGSHYIGAVVRVARGPAAPHTGSGPVETGTSGQVVSGNPQLVHEEGQTVDPTRHIGEHRLGEEMGPVPTIALGNSGPENQSAERHYATATRADLGEVQSFAVRPGRINLGILTPLIWVLADSVRAISMERIVLTVDAVPDAWRRRPS
jgi:hypothetical protein